MSPGWRERVRSLKKQTLTVYFIARDPALPWALRLLALLVAAYALSPIDLIPDFIPVLGWLDDLLIVPLGLALVIRLSPPELLERAKRRADAASVRPVSYLGAAAIAMIWLLGLGLLAAWLSTRV